MRTSAALSSFCKPWGSMTSEMGAAGFDATANTSSHTDKRRLIAYDNRSSFVRAFKLRDFLREVVGQRRKLPEFLQHGTSFRVGENRLASVAQTPLSNTTPSDRRRRRRGRTSMFRPIVLGRATWSIGLAFPNDATNRGEPRQRSGHDALVRVGPFLLAITALCW